MIEFKWFDAIFLLPLPLIFQLLIYLRLIFSRKYYNKITSTIKANDGLVIPYYSDLISLTNIKTINKNRNQFFDFINLINFLKIILWFSFIIALMRPVWLGEPVTLPTPTHDIIMAIDISGSMQSDDMSGYNRITRLDVVKQIGHQFIAKRKQDRIGLVFFGTAAFVSSPLTLDQESLHNFLEKTQVGFAGEKTAIGDALGLAIKRIESANSNNGFIILLSDGSNNSGVVEPIEAAKVAAKHNIKIYTIGIGKTTNSQLDILSGMALDETTLKSMAEITNGKYFHATSKQALATIYNQINQLEPNNKDHKTLRPEKEWFFYPLLLTLIISILLFIIKENKRT